MPDLLLILIIILIVVVVWRGPKTLPKLGEALGRGVREAKSEAGKALEIQSHVTRGIGFNRTIGDLGLVLGPLFVGYFISVFTGNPLMWFISYGLTSAVLGAVSFFVLGTKATCSIMPRQK